MIFLTVSHPRPVTTAKSVTVIIPHRLSTQAWSRYVYQTEGGAKGGQPRSSGRTPDTRPGAPPSPATRASSRWAPSATLETVCPCASPGRCGIADISATPVVPPARTGCNHPRTPFVHSRNPSVHQTHDRANFDSSMEPNSYVQAGTSRMNRLVQAWDGPHDLDHVFPIRGQVEDFVQVKEEPALRSGLKRPGAIRALVDTFQSFRKTGSGLRLVPTIHAVLIPHQNKPPICLGAVV